MTATAKAADRLLAQRDQILDRWLARVRAQVAAAKDELRPILVDTVPAFIVMLADAIDPSHPRLTATDGSSIAQEHGGERRRLTNYRLRDVVREYQLLRDVVLEVLDATGGLTAAERHVILTSIDSSVSEAVMAFAQVEEAFRERFTVSLAHDLRSPMTAIKTGVDLIQRRPDAAEVPQWAARIADNVTRMDRMLKDLLDASAARAGARMRLQDLAPCELTDLARSCIEHIQLAHGRECVLVAPTAIHGTWSPTALSRAIENLLVNAVKYGDPQAPVTVTVEATHGRAILKVHNFGSYIPASEQDGLFEPFRRTVEAQKSGARGWGIGLTVVRAVAEAHGGSVGVDSLPERGTAFLIDIPLDATPFQTTG